LPMFLRLPLGFHKGSASRGKLSLLATTVHFRECEWQKTGKVSFTHLEFPLFALSK
jgi:hypothetical protein